VLNPFEIWLMVVLIVGISLAAYVGYRILGPEAGSVAAGLLGGLISSTALAVSYARRAGDSPATTATATVAVMVASTVVFARVLVEIAVIAPGVLPAVAAPLAIMGIVMAAVSAVVYGLAGKRLAAAEPDEEPPADLRSAILFGLLYAGIILAVAVAKARYGQAGLYVVSGLSGLTDMDAITLSTANLVRSGRVEASLGWRLLLVGAMSNMLFKAGAIGILGTRRLFLSVALSFGVAIATGVLLLLLWPG
jgi:uncharacterized membrane protein (DUF4010 family)